MSTGTLKGARARHALFERQSATNAGWTSVRVYELLEIWEQSVSFATMRSLAAFLSAIGRHRDILYKNSWHLACHQAATEQTFEALASACADTRHYIETCPPSPGLFGSTAVASSSARSEKPAPNRPLISPRTRDWQLGDSGRFSMRSWVLKNPGPFLILNPGF